jgi:hypothetical protein
VREPPAGVEAFVAFGVPVHLAKSATLRQNVRVRSGLWGVLVWLLAVFGARADEGVVLREGGAPRPGLCAALRIQLSGIAPVSCEAEPARAPLSERIAATAARLRAQNARLGVLLERDPEPGLLRMYIVAARNDQAVLAIERIEDRPEPDIDRSLALKVSDAYEVVAMVQAAAPERALPLAAAVTPAPAPRERWQPLLEMGGGPHFEPGNLRWLGNMLIGVGIGKSGLRSEIAAGVRLDTQAEAGSAAARVRMRERGALLSLRLLWRGARFELGGVLEGVFSYIRADAHAESERDGEERFFSPALGLGADLRLRLFGSVFLRAAPTLELMLYHEQLAIDGQAILETGPVRAALPLSLLVHLPL